MLVLRGSADLSAGRSRRHLCEARDRQIPSPGTPTPTTTFSKRSHAPFSNTWAKYTDEVYGAPFFYSTFVGVSIVEREMSSSLRFPEELLQPPRCLVAMSGLDVRNNAVHRAVWDEFTQGGRRSERKPVLYRNIPPDHLYPKTSEPVKIKNNVQ